MCHLLYVCKSGIVHAFLCCRKSPLIQQLTCVLTSEVLQKKKKEKTKFNSKVGNNPFCSWRHSELGCMEWCCLCSEVPAALQSTQLGAPSCGRWIVEYWEGRPLPPLHHPPGELVSQPMDSDQWLKYNSYSYRSQGKHDMTIILSVWEAKIKGFEFANQHYSDGPLT